MVRSVWVNPISSSSSSRVRDLEHPKIRGQPENVASKEYSGPCPPTGQQYGYVKVDQPHLKEPERRLNALAHIVSNYTTRAPMIFLMCGLALAWAIL